MAQDKNMHRAVTNIPLAYFITVRTYGTWLHGDRRGSVDREHNQYGTPVAPPNAEREQFEREQLGHAAMLLTAEAAALVERTIREVCEHRGWKLFTVKARTNHFHAVVCAPATAERVMNDCKAWATRRLREHGFAAKDAQVWADHGSTPHLWTPDELLAAIDYVENRQGAALRSEPEA